MRVIRVFLIRMGSLFAKQSRNAELSEELEFHLAKATEENIARGMSPEDAVAAARTSFGNVVAAAEDCYEARGTAWIERWVQDLHFGIRSLRRHPMFSTATVLVLALGTGTCTAIFSLADAVLFRSLPYSKADQLVYVYTPSQQLVHMGIPANVFNPSFADFSDLRAQSRSFSSMTQFQVTSMNLAAGGHVDRVGAARIDPEFFRTLDIQPVTGHGFDQSDEQPGSNYVAVISHEIWENSFGGSRSAVGSVLTLDGRSYRVVGVMPEGFGYPDRTNIGAAGIGNIGQTQIWVPLALTTDQSACREGCGAFVLARLRSGTTSATAQTELTNLMGRLDPLHRGPLRDLVANVDSLRNVVIGPVRTLMKVLLASVGLVLLIACANATGLLFTRAADRTHELGMRMALGARRERLVRQMATESLLLCLGGAVVGSGLAWLQLHAMLALHPVDIPRLQDAALNLRAFGFIAMVTGLTALFVGAVPAFLASRVDLGVSFASRGTRGVLGGRRRIRKVLAIGQIALVVVLLTGAGLMLRSYVKVMALPGGYSRSTLSGSIQFSSPLRGVPENPRYSTTDKRRRFFIEVLNRVQHAPGVQAAGLIDALPLTGREEEASFEVEGQPNEKNLGLEIRHVSPNWFASMQIPLLIGRDFTASDGPDTTRVAVVNRAFVTMYLGRKGAVGEHIRLSQTSQWMTVVGIIGDARIYRPEDAPAPQIYTCLWQDEISGGGYFTLRSTLSQQAAESEIRAVVHSFDPNIAVADVHTLGDLESELTARRRFQTMLMGSFSSVALGLALVGIYSVLAYAVRQRTAEIGIRMALGSNRIGILILILREGMMILVAGLLIGTVVAVMVTHSISGLLYGIPPTDPITYAFVPCLLLLGTLAACVVPGLRAARLDPMHALRHE
jgi:predicted permease